MFTSYLGGNIRALDTIHDLLIRDLPKMSHQSNATFTILISVA